MTKLIPKKQTAWGTLEYKGPQYYEVVEQMKKESPQAYNRLQIEKAKDQQSNSEIVNYIDAEGKPRTAPVVKGMSGADPIGQLYVEGVILNSVFKGLGRVAEYGLAKAGNNWARAKILSREMYNISTPNKTVPNNVGWAPKQTIQVSHARNRNEIPDLYFEKRWDVVNEGANPHGIWYQGRLGVPRTDATNPGKGAKAQKARDLFANRKYHLKGEVTFEKPMQTIGDVKNRSWLSYDADNMGADGLIYNDIYDNGYNHNQVILGWKQFNNNILASIYDNPDQYKGRISDRVINYIKQRKEVGKSLEDSRDFIQSTAVKNSKETNQKIADRLSLPRQAEYDLQRKPVIYHHTFGQKNYNYKGVSSDNVGGYYDRTKKTINLRQNYPNLQAAKTIPFHENLHAQGYGPSAVNEWKIQYLIDKDKIVNMSKRDKDYFLSSEELPVHTATLGKSWGIKSGQPYPGDKAFDEMLYNKGIGGASYYLKYDTPKDKRRFWRTLNGTMFGLSPLIILNKNEQFSN